MKYTQEEIDRAASVSISDYFKSRGYDCEQRGKEIHIKGFGGFNVNPQTNEYFIFSQNKGGRGAVNALRDVLDMSFPEAMKELVGEPTHSYINREDKPEKKVEFIMPEKAENCKKVYAYLINQRGLSADIISDFVKQGILYQGFTESVNKETGEVHKHENAIFLHKNEKGIPCGADVQGIYSEVKFKGIIPPDKTDKGFVYNKGDLQKIDTVYLFEAPIDLMSFVQLHPEIENAKFVSMGGLKPSIAEHYINSNMNVVSCVDNDSPGQSFNNRIMRGKMQAALSAVEGDVDPKSFKDREPPIEYLEAAVNGKNCFFFLSKEDYKDFNSAKTEKVEMSSAFIWINRSNFTVNKECAEAGVKDFNDLLKSRTSLSEKLRDIQKYSETVKYRTGELNNEERKQDTSKVRS